MKVAIVHYWLTNLGGGERVLLELHKQFPDAPIYTSVFDKKALPEFADMDIRTTWLQWFPFRFRHQLFSLLRPLAFKSLNLKEYDLVITSDSAEAKNVRVRKNATHICYCNTPPRYYWSHYDEFIKSPGLGPLNPLARILLRIVARPLRWIDYRAAQKVDFFIANSNTIKSRIKKYYKRDSTVIYPPVNTERFTPQAKYKREGFVHVGRMIPMKRIDLAVEVCNQLKLPLVVAGRGSEYENLKKLAGETVDVLHSPSDKEIENLLHKSAGFIFSAEEDLGIAPIEAMAAGVPVLAYNKGGATETVVPGKTGEFFDTQSIASLSSALKKFDTSKYKTDEILRQADKFSEDSFRLNMQEFVDSKIKA